MVAVEEEALVHPDNTTALPEVVVEEQQVLGHALQVKGRAHSHSRPVRWDPLQGLPLLPCSCSS